MKKKLNLNTIIVESFSTNLEIEKMQTIQGADSYPRSWIGVCATDACPLGTHPIRLILDTRLINLSYAYCTLFPKYCVNPV